MADKHKYIFVKYILYRSYRSLSPSPRFFYKTHLVTFKLKDIHNNGI